MRNHTLMQTIARANRTLPGKEAGLIVDYVGVFRNLQKALAIYGQPTGEGDSPIKSKSELLAALSVHADQMRQYCTDAGGNLDAALTAPPGSMERLAAFESLFEAIVSPDDIRRGFQRGAGDFIRIYKAVLPDDAAATFAPMASLLSAMVKRLRTLIQAPDVSAVMEKIEGVLDETISAEDYRLKGGEQPLFNLSDVDFDALRERFNTGKKRTEAEKLRALLEHKVQAMAEVNRFRLDLVQKLEDMIQRYNSGSQNLETWFEELLHFTQEVSEEESRALREGLSEEELAIFDILTKPEPQLDDKQREQVKAIAKDLLEKLKADKLVLDWWRRQQTRSAVRSFINRTLGKGLPETPYSDDIYEEKCELAYMHIFEKYRGSAASIYP
jgi:type I restriction enzyme R subunit